MKIILNKNILLKLIHREKNLGFVPTMGAIHPGHISLIKRSIAECDKTIVSIFVNEPQFNRKIDFQKYPKNTKGDIYLLKKYKIDYLYLPNTKQIYPNGSNNKIKISPFSKKLCGKFRPGHFKAIADVIDRFIKIIKPKKIYLGNKDMQQLKIIEHFVRKNHKRTEVIGCATIREKSGIAYSSRNQLLSAKEKLIASKIYKILVAKKNRIIRNIISLKKIKKEIIDIGVSKVEYLEIFDINKVIRPHKKRKRYKIFISYYFGTTRLIDNI